MAAEDLGLSMQGGFLRPLPPNATREEQSAVLNDIINRLNDQLRTQLFTDGQSKRFVQGYVPGRWPDGDFGLAISPEGQDVLTVDFDELLFAWDFSSNKQYIRGGIQEFYDADSSELALSIGKMDDDNMAFKTYDTDGVPIGLFGQSPKDRHGGSWTVGPGKNVDTLLKNT